jgi:polyisoprenyl-teichoic acid--peptidoglycan teichoic acid transferase
VKRRARTALRSKWTRRVALGALVLVLLVAALGLHRLADIGGAISTQGAFTTQTGYMTGSKRVNLVVLGYGGVGHNGAYLTDSMMVISVVPDSGSTTEISVPRDLWVQVPPNSGTYAKINAAYQDGFYNGYGGMAAGRVAGGAEAAEKVSEVLGMTVPYWLTIDFSGFRGLVDALGGVDLDVPVAFTAQYPANDDPSINPNWITIHFQTGWQHMDGERAIEYARARYVTDPPSQGSDFARSARQQQLIRGILSRARQISAWSGLNGAADALEKTVYTNLSLLDLLLFAQRMDTTHAAHIGLSDQNLLVDAQSSDGQSILQPANGDWGAIQQYVQQNLKP